MQIWRRSYDVPPPGGESLKDTLARALPYYVQEILPRVLRGERMLVAAHGNSLRALSWCWRSYTPDSILKLDLATGVPMIYRLNADSTVASKLDLAAEFVSGGLAEGVPPMPCMVVTLLAHPTAQCTPTCPASQPSIARLRVMPQ